MDFPSPVFAKIQAIFYKYRSILLAKKYDFFPPSVEFVSEQALQKSSRSLGPQLFFCFLSSLYVCFFLRPSSSRPVVSRASRRKVNDRTIAAHTTVIARVSVTINPTNTIAHPWISMVLKFLYFLIYSNHHSLSFLLVIFQVLILPSFFCFKICDPGRRGWIPSQMSDSEAIWNVVLQVDTLQRTAPAHTPSPREDTV